MRKAPQTGDTQTSLSYSCYRSYNRTNMKSQHNATSISLQCKL